ncbi:MAG: tandem-95 repeat protein [Lentisphaerae bacterium]|nr:tandem-95 repeat protein [Lentisphaerota bacterium]
MNRQYQKWPRLHAGVMAALVVLGVCRTSQAQNPIPIDYAVRLYAQVAESPPSITLNWATNSFATSYEVCRRPFGVGPWVPVATNLAASPSSWVDTNVVAGLAYEYWVKGGIAQGFLYGGIRMPLVEARGKLVLIVDNTYAADLSNELARLQLDLAGDGWTVLRHDVARTAAVTQVKALITADYLADSNAVKSVLLFGHVPVPYSGNTAPDGHGEHVGAWGCDAFYGDMDGTWTDTTLNIVTGYMRNHNTPGDGKYDQTDLPSAVELQVGRVDLYDLPTFAQPERELLRQYLNKAHNFRHQYFVADKRGLVDDNFGMAVGIPGPATHSWSGFSALFTPTNVFARHFDTDLAAGRYLWAYGCGGGWWRGANGVDTTDGLASGPRQAVFSMLFGSYFGEWDTSDNLMRATLASTPSILTCAWSGFQPWLIHAMGVGEPIGVCARASQNSRGGMGGASDYPSPYYASMSHVALMGDPTLRLLPVAPPTDLSVAPSGSDAELAWQPSADPAILGYHVYRSDGPSAAFARISTELVTTTNYVDTGARTGTVTYMVRAVKLEQTPSGSYSNLSQGLFNRLTLAGDMNHAPVVTNRTIITDEDVPVAIPLDAADADGDPLWLGLRAFPQKGQLTGAPTNYVYRPATNAFGNDSFVYYAGDGLTDGGTAVVTIVINAVNDAPSARNQSVTATNNRPAAIHVVALDPEGSALTYTLVTPPAQGTLTGTLPDLVYTPTNVPFGTDTIAFSASDGTLNGNTGTVTITVVDPPTALPDTATTPEDTPVIINVLANDSDPNGDVVSISAVTAPLYGIAVIQGTNVTYTPSEDYFGEDSFTYTASDGHSGRATAQVTVTVTAVNDPPLARNRSVRVLSGITNAITLRASDADDDPLTFAILRTPTNGTVIVGPGGSNPVAYAANPGYIGPDSFQFRAFDGTVYGTTGTVTITVIPSMAPAAVSGLEDGLDYMYYEGAFTNVPDTNLLTPVKQGVSTNGFDLDLRQRDTNIAFRFTGYLNIPQSGEYSLYIGADQGASVWLWNTPVSMVDTSPGWTLSDPIGLLAGCHPITVVYYNDSVPDTPPFLSLYLLDVYDSFMPFTLARVSDRPSAVLNCSGATGGVPLSVTFDATGSSDTNGTIVSYAWDFGDGASAAGPIVTHTYMLTGAFTATLTVTDNDGARDSVATSITVSYRPNALTYAEPFEDYPAGATMSRRRGWPRGESATVSHLNYAAAYAGGTYPLNTSPHTKVIAVEDGVTNEIVGGSNRIVTVEYVLHPSRIDDPPPMSPDIQLSLAVGANGAPFVYHGQPGAVTGIWSEVPAIIIGTDEWIRVTTRLDYQTVDAVSSSHYGRIWINGVPLLSDAAYSANNGLGAPGGPWFALADTSRPYMSELITRGNTFLDDVLATDIDPDGTTSNDTPIRWLMENVGVTNDYDALAAEDSDGDGSLNWAERIAGTQPLDAESRFRVISAGRSNGTNWIAWYGTTNGGVATPFAVARGTNLAAAADVVVSNLARSATGTNLWLDGNAPTGTPAFYRPVILP